MEKTSSDAQLHMLSDSILQTKQLLQKEIRDVREECDRKVRENDGSSEVFRKMQMVIDVLKGEVAQLRVRSDGVPRELEAMAKVIEKVKAEVDEVKKESGNNFSSIDVKLMKINEQFDKIHKQPTYNPPPLVLQQI